jgi:hypothetical protein
MTGMALVRLLKRRVAKPEQVLQEALPCVPFELFPDCCLQHYCCCRRWRVTRRTHIDIGGRK